MLSYTSSINKGEYCISKAGASTLAKLFADRLAEKGISIYEVRPGIINADMTKVVKVKYDKLINNGIIPIKRMRYSKCSFCLLFRQTKFFTGDRWWISSEESIIEGSKGTVLMLLPCFYMLLINLGFIIL